MSTILPSVPTQLFGHFSEETAFTIHTFPYNYGILTSAEFWVDENPQYGGRLVSKVLNPYTKNWNPTKTSKYADLVFMIQIPSGLIIPHEINLEKLGKEKAQALRNSNQIKFTECQKIILANFITMDYTLFAKQRGRPVGSKNDPDKPSKTGRPTGRPRVYPPGQAPSDLRGKRKAPEPAGLKIKEHFSSIQGHWTQHMFSKLQEQFKAEITKSTDLKSSYTVCLSLIEDAFRSPYRITDESLTYSKESFARNSANPQRSNTIDLEKDHSATNPHSISLVWLQEELISIEETLEWLNQQKSSYISELNTLFKSLPQ